MVRRAAQFTPEVLLSAPRRSVGVPVQTASGGPGSVKILYTTSTYSFETHQKTTELRVLDVETDESFLLTEDHDISDLNWLNEDEFVCLQAEKDGTTKVYWASESKTRQGLKYGDAYYVAGKIDAPAANLKVKKLESGDFAVVLSAQANPDGSLFNPENASKVRSTGKLYTGLFVRHWDRYETKEKNALFYGTLSKNHDGKYQLSELTNALAKSGLECPIRPFGGTDSFDLSQDKVLLVAKDPDINPALNTKCNVYVLSIDSWNGSKPVTRTQIEVAGFEGAASSPIFSPDGTKAAFLKMKENGYESDRNQICVISFENSPALQLKAHLAIEDAIWDRSPGSITFMPNGESLLATTEDNGTSRVYEISIDSKRSTRRNPRPLPLAFDRYVSDVRPLADGRFFFSGSTLTENSYYAIVSTSHDIPHLWKHSLGGSKFGLNESQVSTIWTPASNPSINKEVHSIVVKPSTFDPAKKYPVAYLIHGGPQGAWANSWSTRWNPAVFAEQGYIVVAPNPTGSTGYGQAFTDAIQNNWGGDPYHDIVNVFEWVGENMPEADNGRAVALGASYGGYMMNWIQGHPLGRKFKALVCHDGITSAMGGQLPTDELYFPFRDLGRPDWAKPNTQSKPSPSPWDKWDPSQHFHNWATPQLVIHSAQDFRLPIGEGLAAFNVLQTRGVESQFLTFPDENHWVLKPENSLLWHKVVLNWINKYVGLPAYADESDYEAFFGGVKKVEEEKDKKAVEMPTGGKPET